MLLRLLHLTLEVQGILTFENFENPLTPELSLSMQWQPAELFYWVF